MVGKEEINWKTITEYVCIDTGEILSKEQVRTFREYYIIKIKKKTNVYKQTGTIKYTYECKKSGQTKLGF